MTYLELSEYIKGMSREQLNQSVTVYVRGIDEYYGLEEDYPVCESTEDCDVLDPDHVYLVI